MPKLIKNGQLVDDNAEILVLDESQAPEALSLPAGPVFVPMAVWQAHKSAFSDRSDVGVWLDSHDNVEDLAPDLGEISAVALNFPKFTDGRAFSQAVLLRRRWRFAGDLRATGDVLIDQLVHMHRSGFTSAVLAAGVEPAAAERQFARYSAYYQGDVLEPRPLFAREAA